MYQKSYKDFWAITYGDKLFSRVLVDRDFYKWARIFSSQNKKEGKTLERFEQQMRNGMGKISSKAWHWEFLTDLTFHAKNFLEFHKKKCTKLKKYALDTKNRLSWIEKKEQQKKDQMEK